MAMVIEDNIQVCECCSLVVAGYDQHEAPEIAYWNIDGIVEYEKQHNGRLVNVDGFNEFSHTKCATCNELAGTRYTLALLKD